MVQVSVIICTASRPDSLRLTLASLRSIRLDHGVTAELLVVDNSAGDAGIREAVADIRLPWGPARYIHEPTRGLSNARNRGLDEADGRVILFTDDDVRVPPDWITQMSLPILRGTADAVAGGVRIASHLHRPWMTLRHRLLLTTTEHMDPAHVDCMTGANMAFSRDVLKVVPRFDPELGAGALGYLEETLFARQLLAAGFRIISGLHVVADHHFDASRLSRRFLTQAALKGGRSAAYVAYHWEHRDVMLSRRRPYIQRAELFFGRLRRSNQSRQQLLTEWEQNLLFQLEFERQYRVEKQRRRLYDRFGFVKKQDGPAAGKRLIEATKANTPVASMEVG